ncbi:histidine--tRNA ligase [Metallosphaera javensis (ex Sakai et al. 2022)]|uniref:histidine--tRNA ligase n=1 Tax=Metallosphaera javensis (ex Sakai et al. 2022) TaxID=2775498 RepID=UPI002590C04E|nr:MAG: histidine--tRNA ligase [Metallosphaera javensis (ex Sakai et al. 2022)]
MVSYEPMRGMEDYFDADSKVIRWIEDSFRETAEIAGYKEAMTPIVEDFELFSLKGGEELRNTMYVFKDKGDREVALRPEITPSIVRLYLNSLQHYPKPLRIFYIGRVYRYDEPQQGRYREFRQAGVELLGSDSIMADIEVLHLLENFYRKIHLKDKISIKINNIGIFRIIFNYLSLNDQVQEHLLHLLDKGKIEEAEKILGEKISENSKIRRFVQILITNGKSVKLNEVMDEAEKTEVPELKNEIEKLRLLSDVLSSLNLNHTLDFGFVRGLAYYTGPIFEAVKKDLPFSIAGGGRYDSLVEVYGGNRTPAVGFAIGIERTMYAIDRDKMKLNPEVPVIAVVALDMSVIPHALTVVSMLRDRGFVTILNNKEISLSKLVPFYAEQGFTHLVIIGQKEVTSGKVTVRNLIKREQLSAELKELPDMIVLSDK